MFHKTQTWIFGGLFKTTKNLNSITNKTSLFRGTSTGLWLQSYTVISGVYKLKHTNTDDSILPQTGKETGTNRFLNEKFILIELKISSYGKEEHMIN